MGDAGEINCKVVLLGESGVGKTSIISRYISNTYRNQQLRCQEKYRSLAKVFYKMQQCVF